MDVTQKLIERLKHQGVNTGEVIYSVCVEDVVECIAEVFGEKASNMPAEELKELVDVGVEGTEHIDWWNPIVCKLNDSFHSDPQGDAVIHEN